MFQRQTREPFPTRNIILLAAVVLGFLLFIFSQLKKKGEAPPSPPVEQTR